jgi:hypothetical protein
MAKVDGLSSEQTEQVLRFLLHRMSMDTRRSLMANLPQAYARLYPTVTAATLIDYVQRDLPVSFGPTEG